MECRIPQEPGLVLITKDTWNWGSKGSQFWCFRLLDHRGAWEWYSRSIGNASVGFVHEGRLSPLQYVSISPSVSYLCQRQGTWLPRSGSYSVCKILGSLKKKKGICFHVHEQFPFPPSKGMRTSTYNSYETAQGDAVQAKKRKWQESYNIQVLNLDCCKTALWLDTQHNSWAEGSRPSSEKRFKFNCSRSWVK